MSTHNLNEQLSVTKCKCKQELVPTTEMKLQYAFIWVTKYSQTPYSASVSSPLYAAVYYNTVKKSEVPVHSVTPYGGSIAIAPLILNLLKPSGNFTYRQV
jgi:hypothetical protein